MSPTVSLPPYSSAFGGLRALPFAGRTAATYPSGSPTSSAVAPVSPTVSPSSSPKKTRKSRVVFDFTTEEMARYFHMSQREAAAQLGVATVTIKRNCRRLGIVWPYRLLKSKKHPAAWCAISREQAKLIREERARARVLAKRNVAAASAASSSAAVAAATAMTMLSHAQAPAAALTPAGRAFARLPLDCMAAHP